MSLIISIRSIYLTHEYKKEIQENEFDFSKKMLWYERQADAIDELMVNLTNMNRVAWKLLNTTEVNLEELKTLSSERDEYVKIYNMKRHYMDDKEILKKYKENIELVAELFAMVQKNASKSDKKINHDKFMDNGREIITRVTKNFF